MPGVEHDGVELEVNRNVVIVTAHRPPPVVCNWQAANLGAVQHDYQLRIRCPHAIDPEGVWGELRQGVLQLHLRKMTGRVPARHRRS